MTLNFHAAQSAAKMSAPVFPLVVEDAAVRIQDERGFDAAAREMLLDDAFGAERFAKTCERLREGRLPARHLALVAKEDDVLVGTLRFWDIQAGGASALLLGPLAIAETHRTLGLGGAMMRTGLARARALGHKAVLLVGDEPYYRRFGFARTHAAKLELPGWVNPERFLGLELVEGALAQAAGAVVATGRSEAQSFKRAA